MTARRRVDFRLGERPALHGIRAIAVLGVMVAHAQFYRHVRVPGQGGVRGVLVFFVLSGFLITKLLLEDHDDHSKIRLGRFYLRRALRLLPALIVLVGICLLLYIVDPRTGPVVTTARAVPVTLLYVANWSIAIGHKSLGAFGHLWSLSVEEQFYLLWPLVLMAGLRWIPRRRSLIVLTLAAATLSAILYGLVGPSSDARAVGTDASAHGLLIGCALGIWLHESEADDRQRLARAFRWLIVPSVAYLIAGFTLLGPPAGLSIAYDHVLTELATAVVIGFLMLGPESVLHRVLSSRPMVAIGIRSYGLYLWHFPVLVFADYLSKSGNLAALISLPLSFVIAFASYAWVERPCLRLKRHFENQEGPDVVRHPRLVSLGAVGHT